MLRRAIISPPLFAPLQLSLRLSRRHSRHFFQRQLSSAADYFHAADTPPPSIEGYAEIDTYAITPH